MLPIRKLEVGNADEAFGLCDVIAEGEVSIGGQEHFYMETQACLAIPQDGGNEMELICSTQSPSHLQV